MANSSIGSRPWLSEAHNENCSFKPVVLLIYTQKWIWYRNKSPFVGEITGVENCNEDTGRFKYVGVGLILALLKIGQLLLLGLPTSKTVQDVASPFESIRCFTKSTFLADQENDSFCPVIVPLPSCTWKRQRTADFAPKSRKNGVHAWIPTKA